MALLIILFLLVLTMGSTACLLESAIRSGASRKHPVFLADWEIKLIKMAASALVRPFKRKLWPPQHRHLKR